MIMLLFDTEHSSLNKRANAASSADAEASQASR